VRPVGGIASGGWRESADHAPDQVLGGVGRVVVAAALLLLVLGGVLVIRRLSHDPSDARFWRLSGGSGGPAALEGLEVTVGPWPVPGAWRPTEDTVVMLLSGGPLPVDTDGEIRWMTDGETLRLGRSGAACRQARPIRTTGVWMSCVPAATPARGASGPPAAPGHGT